MKKLFFFLFFFFCSISIFADNKVDSIKIYSEYKLQRLPVNNLKQDSLTRSNCFCNQFTQQEHAEFNNMIDLIIKAAPSIIAIIGFCVGLSQYIKAQHWKRAEFASKELDKLNSDHLLSMACTLLDWDGRTFAVPDSYKYKAEEPSFIHNWAELEKAMVSDIRPVDAPGFTWKEVLYRDIFDHYFNYLDLINHYIEIKLIKINDVKTLRYWLIQIAGSPLANEKPIFQDYIIKFGYEGINRLSNKLGVALKK
jgi:hypothetical protein